MVHCGDIQQEDIQGVISGTDGADDVGGEHYEARNEHGRDECWRDRDVIEWVGQPHGVLHTPGLQELLARSLYVPYARDLEEH